MQFPRVDVVFRHPVADLAEIPADVGQGRAMTEQAGGQGVPGLVRDEMAEVHGVHPGPEPAVEPLVSERHRSVVAAVDRGEQRELGALRAGRPVAGAGGEPVQGLALAFGENIVETFGDPDRDVVVADLGLVVPEHREPAVAADAVPPHLDDLADPAAGGDSDLPDVTGPVVAGVIGGGKLCETRSPWPRWSAGTGTARTSMPACRCCPPGSVTSTRPTPTGITPIPGLFRCALFCARDWPVTWVDALW